MEQSATPDWAKRFFAVTPFVDDLATARQWYVDVFGMWLHASASWGSSP